MNDSLTRIGVFYDGSFFAKVSDYYAYFHPRQARLSIGGMHEFIRHRVAREEQVDVRKCLVVDVHYFRGRFSAETSERAGKLVAQHQFEDVLVQEGVTTHFLPMRSTADGGKQVEKGIDVWFALEAYELAIYKRFDVCVLITGDADFVPLARKLNTLGTRVMVLGWDVDIEVGRSTKTSQALLREVSYPVLVSALIDDKTQREVVDGLFLRDPPAPKIRRAEEPSQVRIQPAGATSQYVGTIKCTYDRGDGKRFGFIVCPEVEDDIWFGADHVEGPTAFDALRAGNTVSFELGSNKLGRCGRRVHFESGTSDLAH